VLALHGLTGHGRRWETLATGCLDDVAVLAPDLLGHGRSSWSAPWTIDANVAALADLLTEPVLAVGHSFGAAVALHLAAARPDLVSGLVLLDPAIGLDGGWMRELADAMFASPDYTDAAEARTEKSSGSWADVDTALLATEVAEHLIELSNGRVGWRVSIPAMMSYWSELARDIVLPPNGIPITMVRAKRTTPPYVAETLIAGLRERAGGAFRLVDLDCGHMVPLAKPVDTANIIREHLQRRTWRR
jgi:lipase